MIFVFIVLLALPALPLHADPLAETQARFGVITGDAGLLSQGAADWIEPHEGLPIEAGDQIRTGEDGRAEVLLSESAVWRLEPETHLATESMDTNSGRFTLSSGTLFGIVDSAHVAGRVQRWEFSTPAAAVSVHGTQFVLVASKAQGTRLAVVEGTVGLAPAETAEGLQPPVQVLQGQEAVVQRNRPVQRIKPFSPSMKALTAKMPAFSRRQLQIENTWSPFTTTTRLELRKKYVAAIPKVNRARPRARPSRQRPSDAVQN